MREHVLKLGVNVDHVATLRQARGTEYPSPLDAGRVCQQAGADGITVHLREDRRHIQDRDVRELKEALSVPLNLEMACTTEVMAFALAVKPAEVCLVPEKREELTTEGGLDARGLEARLAPAVRALTEAGVDVSLFIEPDPEQIRAARDLGAPTIELHTGRYCLARGASAEAERERLVAGARLAHELGLRVNAGHGIHLGNVKGILAVPHLDTLNIGHSIVARAVFVGLPAAVREMREAMAAYAGGRP
jgi:pyridoxine 5-phosphate synthase